MNRSAQEHRQEFQELGYTIFEGVLSQEEIDYALPIFDETITIDTMPPVVTGVSQSRRQLNSAQYCEPRLSNFGGHPRLLEAVAVLIDCPFSLIRSPVPCVTFPGSAGGPAGPQWVGHVDWWHTPPAEHDDEFVYGLVHFTTVEPNGGGFTVCPGSHRLVAECLQNAELSERMFRQQFKDFPGLAPAQEMRPRAGDVLFYHAFLVHGGSDNQSQQPRKVLFTHYLPSPDEAAIQRIHEAVPNAFHPDHVAAMDKRFRRLCGIE